MRKLKARQRVVQARRHELASAADALVDYGEQPRGPIPQQPPPDPVKVEKRRVADQRLHQAVEELTALWGRAQLAHPVLAAFRGGSKNLDDVDLGALDETAHGREPQMAEMLKKVLPTWRRYAASAPGSSRRAISTPSLYPRSSP